MKKFIFTLLALIAFNCNATVSIIFINGITTNKVGAQNNLMALAHRYCITYKKGCSDVVFRYIYNRTDGFFDDSGELRIQSQADTKSISSANDIIKKKLPSKYKPNPFDYVVGSDEHNLFMAYVKTYLSNIYFEEQLISSGVWRDINTLYLDPDNANSTVAGVFNSIAVEVLKELSLDGNTRRVVIVPHSQGNYFAQAVQSFVASKVPDSSNRLRVQGVASVSSIAQLAGEHTSHARDQALFAHTTESLLNFSRQPNFEAGWKLGATSDKDDYLNAHPDDKTNHGMLEVYMGMKLIQLPLDGYNCSDKLIPTEEYSEFVETYKLRSGRRCQKDTEVSNGTVLIGVGNKFPDLRGTQLPLHIINKVFNSVAATSQVTVVTPSASFDTYPGVKKITSKIGTFYFTILSPWINGSKTSNTFNVGTGIGSGEFVLTSDDFIFDVYNDFLFEAPECTDGGLIGVSHPGLPAGIPKNGLLYKCKLRQTGLVNIKITHKITGVVIHAHQQNVGDPHTKISNAGGVLPIDAKQGDGENDWGCTKFNKNGDLYLMNRPGNLFLSDDVKWTASGYQALVYHANITKYCGRSNWRVIFGDRVWPALMVNNNNDVKSTILNYMSENIERWFFLDINGYPAYVDDYFDSVPSGSYALGFSWQYVSKQPIDTLYRVRLVSTN